MNRPSGDGIDLGSDFGYATFLEFEHVTTSTNLAPRTVWILGPGSLLSGVVLGPTLRLVQMAKLARSSGHDPVIAMEAGREGSFDGIRTCELTPQVIRQIPPGDAVVAVATLHPRLFKALLDTGRGFDLDLYGLGALEHMEMKHPFNDRQVFQSRRRLARRYRILVDHAECVYLSNAKQLTFLGGLFFAEGTSAASELASRLPEKTLFLPMGVPRHDTTPVTSPYPDHFAGRPVFLWGGGIWTWFDTDTLLEAFKLLKDGGSPAALYFICGANPSGSSTHDEPVRKAIRKARDMQLMPDTVVFHDSGVSGRELPAYLQHCAAGIMANPMRLESTASWRTRLLDPLAFGKPVVAAGYDPLSVHLESANAALLVPPGNPRLLAERIEDFCRDPRLRASLEAGSLAVARQLSWESIFTPWLQRLDNPRTFQQRHRRASRLQQFLFALGI